MAESTLALNYDQIQAQLGLFFGIGLGSKYGDPVWSKRDQYILDLVTKKGLARFYWPSQIEGMNGSYDWSFLKPVSQITLQSGASTVVLPDDFGSFDGPITVASSMNISLPWRIEWRNEGIIRGLYAARPNTTGPPMYSTQEPLRGTTGNAGQRFEVMIFPLADQTYTLSVTYYVNPDMINRAMPYAYGGAQHADTIMESCLAAMEEYMDDARTVHRQAFNDRLQASISLDRRNKTQKVGYDYDRSDELYGHRQTTPWNIPAATYNGNPL